MSQAIQKAPSKAVKAPRKPRNVRSEDRPLTRKEQRFLEAYLGEEAAGNATEAARIAGYKAKSRPALAVQGHGVLKKPHVAAHIKAWYDASTRSVEADLAELDRVAHLPDDQCEVPIPGKEPGEWRTRHDRRDKVRALELKLKVRGALSDNLFIRTLPSDPAALAEAARAEIRRILGEPTAPKQLEEAPIEAEIVTVKEEGDK